MSAPAVSAVCSLEGRLAAIIGHSDRETTDEQLELAARAAAAVPLAWEASPELLRGPDTVPYQIVRAGDSVYALTGRSSSPGVLEPDSGLGLREVFVGDTSVKLSQEAEPLPALAAPLLAGDHDDGSLYLCCGQPACVLKRTPAPMQWSRLESFGAMPQGRAAGVAAVDSGKDLWVVGAGADGATALHAYSLDRRRWRQVHSSGSGPGHAEILAASIIDGKDGQCRRLQTHALDLQQLQLTWGAHVAAVSIPALAEDQLLVSEYPEVGSWLVAKWSALDRALSPRIHAFSGEENLWRVADLNINSGAGLSDRRGPQLTKVAEEPSLLGPVYMRLCKQRALKGGAFPQPWHDYVKRRERELTLSGSTHASDAGLIEIHATDLAFFISPPRGGGDSGAEGVTHWVVWSRWKLTDPAPASGGIRTITCPAGLGYDLRMAQCARAALRRCCNEGVMLNLKPAACEGPHVAPCPAGVLALQSPVLDMLLDLPDTSAAPAEGTGRPVVDLPLPVDTRAMQSLKDLVRCLCGYGHVGQLEPKRLLGLLQVADKLDVEGIRREVLAMLRCRLPVIGVLGPLLAMAEAHQHDPKLQQLKVLYLDHLALLLLRDDVDAAHESWLAWALYAAAYDIDCIKQLCTKFLETGQFVQKPAADIAALTRRDSVLAVEQPCKLRAVLEPYYRHQSQLLVDWDDELKARTVVRKGVFGACATKAVRAEEPASDLGELVAQTGRVLRRLQEQKKSIDKLAREKGLAQAAQRDSKKQKKQQTPSEQPALTGLAAEIFTFDRNSERFDSTRWGSYDDGLSTGWAP